MGIDRSKRISFEQVADLYHQTRPEYPSEIIEDIVQLSGIPPKGKILEIGPGSGNATVSFAKLGYEILAIELGKRLTELARENCARYSKVRILNLAFEDWKVQSEVFDLVLSVDAFHWIPPEIAYPKAAEALKPSGSIALVWRIPVDPQTDWSEEIDQIYEELSPQLENPDKSFTEDWVIDIVSNNLNSSGCYKDIVTKSYSWYESISAEGFIQSLRTFSSHYGVDEELREKLYKRIHDVLVRFGGVVQKPRSVLLIHSRVIK